MKPRRRKVLGRFGTVPAVLAAALSLFSGAPAPRAIAAPASAPVATTQAVQAAFTLNLTRFVSWPESAFPAAGTPLVIGTFPRDPINGDLDAAAKGEVVHGHPVQTMRIQTLDDLRKCHVVFLSQNITRQAAVLQRAARQPILVIGDGDELLERGGHVRFVPQPPRIGLRISVDNLKASGLDARAQLLRFAAVP